MDGFVGQFKHHTSVVLQFRMLCHIFPYFQQILVVSIADANVLWAYPWRAHHDIQSLRDGILRHRDVHLVEILLETLKVEITNVVLWHIIDTGRQIVGPVRIHVLAHERHFPTCIKDAVYKPPMVTQATVDIRASPLGAPLVEPRTVGFAESMQVLANTLGIHKPRTLHV